MGPEEIRELMKNQIELARRLMKDWPEWKRDILVRSAQATIHGSAPMVDDRNEIRDVQASH